MSRTVSHPRSLPLSLALALAVVAGLLALLPGAGAPAAAAVRVDTSVCRAHDPTIVRGVCLRYPSPGGPRLAWLGTRRAAGGRIFFCIDFLYGSRLPRSAPEVSTQDLVNQFGDDVGDAEVAALNALVSRWAPSGSTGSDERDAAISLIIRQVMGDGRTPSGLALFPSGLTVGEHVRPPAGGLAGNVVPLADRMWRAASRSRGPYRVILRDRGDGPLRLGRSRTYAVEVRSAAGRPLTGVPVTLTCRGPIRCPGTVTTRRRGAVLRVSPTDTGRFRIRAAVVGPASDGLLFRVRGWRTHGGDTARSAGRQRGWIAQESRAHTRVSARAVIVRSRPQIETRASHAVAQPGTALHDDVRVDGLAPGRWVRVRAELHGPFAVRPGPGDCTGDTVAGEVAFVAPADGDYRTPTVTVESPGHYTWVLRVPRDRWHEAVTTPCGLVEETTLVEPRVPRVTTVVSDQRALVGDRLHDLVRLSGIRDTDVVTVRWWLHGPLAPRRDGACRGLSWSGVRAVDSGSFAATGPGTYRTRSTVVARPGCYTYRERVLPTDTTAGAATPPGIPSETSLVTRPVTPVVPEVPTGPAVPRRFSAEVLLSATAPAHMGSQREPDAADPPTVPTRRATPRYLHRPYPGPSPARARREPGRGRILVPRVGVSLAVVGVGLDGDTMAVPRDRTVAGWLDTTARADDVLGTSVIAGHAADRRRSPHGLWRLSGVRRGDVVRWMSPDGTQQEFVVTRISRSPRAKGLPTELFRTDGPRALHLVTCSARRPGGSFTDNLVVTARAR